MAELSVSLPDPEADLLAAEASVHAWLHRPGGGIDQALAFAARARTLAAWDAAVAAFRLCLVDWRVNPTYWDATRPLRGLGFPFGPAGVGSGL